MNIYVSYSKSECKEFYLFLYSIAPKPFCVHLLND